MIVLQLTPEASCFILILVICFPPRDKSLDYCLKTSRLRNTISHLPGPFPQGHFFPRFYHSRILQLGFAWEMQAARAVLWAKRRLLSGELHGGEGPGICRQYSRSVLGEECSFLRISPAAEALEIFASKIVLSSFPGSTEGWDQGHTSSHLTSLYLAHPAESAGSRSTQKSCSCQALHPCLPQWPHMVTWEGVALGTCRNSSKGGLCSWQLEAVCWLPSLGEDWGTPPGHHSLQGLASHRSHSEGFQAFCICDFIRQVRMRPEETWSPREQLCRGPGRKLWGKTPGTESLWEVSRSQV